jgi:DNA polymerase-1
VARRTVVLDFETKGIEARPQYPPVPVGLAVVEQVGRGLVKKYYAWGHHTGNNTTKQEAGRLLNQLWHNDGIDLVFHNSKFDVDVAMRHFGLPALPWRRCHDTLFLLYLDDPRAPSLSLKPSSERILGMPPEEQDAVREWLIAHGVVKSNQKDWGAHICDAPPSVVGPYAIGDGVRTLKLYKRLLANVSLRGMIPAYERERRLMPILLESETRGIRVDHELLAKDVSRYSKHLEQLEAWLCKKLKTKNLNFDAPDDVAEALLRADALSEHGLTPTGRVSTSIKTMRFHDPVVGGAIVMQSKLQTALRMFMEPWLAQANATGGRIHTNWNQVRGENDKGTRTGRMSSNPNLQNLSNPYEKEIPLPRGFEIALPEVKRYVLADEGELLGSRDYSQQELRVMGHFEDGVLLQAYQADPEMDIHDYATGMINDMLGTKYTRKPIKTLGFGLIYGMGKDLLAEMMDLTVDESVMLKAAYLTLFPGLRELNNDLKQRARLDLPIRTWGGREYYVEPPRMIKGQMRTFDYKLLNYLVQGSSADCTKEAICRYYELRKPDDGRFIAQIHDQIIVSAKPKVMERTMRTLESAMRSVEFDVAMLSDGSVGPSYGTLEEVDY